MFAHEEIRVGIKFDSKPCRMSFPNILKVGDASTDAAGRFSITFEPREEPPLSCSFSATVRVIVFDGGTLVWRSPKRSVSPIVTFRHDILPEVDPEPQPSAKIRGTLTLCGRSATGHRVVGYEVTRIGFPTSLKPCLKGPTNHRLLGTTTVDDQGRFEIDYKPTSEPFGACFFSSALRVEAFDAAVRVWRSPEKPVKPSVRFDQELAPDCPGGSALVRIVNDFGQRAAGAEVFVNGTLEGVTDAAGQLAIEGLAVGDVLAARLRLLENETDRAGHSEDSEDSDRNWSYRVYITSLTLTHDPVGDNPSFQQFVAADLSDVQELVVRRRNAIVGFNLLVSVEWDATADHITYYKDRFLELSELIFNATDGQFLIERFTIVDNGRSWNEADYRIYANWNQPSNARLGGIAGTDGRVKMNPFGAFFPGTLMHEFGHYGFFVSDEYKRADCWPEGEPVLCTLASGVPGTDFSESGSRDACLMRGAQDGSRKKFCSAHPANPHVDCTAQGPEDCWSVIVQQYGGFPSWRLLTSVRRGVIVDRLPDSGIPIGTSTSVPSRADEADSYIPVVAWKPSWHTSSIERAGECPDLIVRVLQGVSPANQAQVTLLTSQGRFVYQGVTQSKNLLDGTSTAFGEIAIRGAHVGEFISVVLPFGASTLQKTLPIESCASPLVVNLPEIAAPVLSLRSRSRGTDEIELAVETEGEKAVVPPTIAILRDGEDEPFILESPLERSGTGRGILLPSSGEDHDLEIMVTTFDPDGNRGILRCRVATRRLMVDEPRTVKSVGGEVELVISEGALETPAQLVIEDVQDLPLPEIGKEDVLLVPPTRISSSRGNELAKQVLLHLNPGGEFDTGSYASSLELLEYAGEQGGWSPRSVQVHELPLVATTSIRSLGVFALVRRGSAQRKGGY